MVNGEEYICLPSTEMPRPLTQAHDVSPPLNAGRKPVASTSPKCSSVISVFCFGSSCQAHTKLSSDFCIMGLCRHGLPLAKVSNAREKG